MKYGIDTSKWQSSKVDYAKAKKAGIEFVFLRIGYNKTKDKCFERDYAAAIAAGLKVGAYYYTIGRRESDGTTDATRVLGWINNRHLDFPIGYDIEDAKQKSTSRRKINSAMYNAFKSKIEQGGVYDAILYTGEYFYNTYFDKSKVTDDLWIAKYSNSAPNVGRQVAIWQYSSDAVNTAYYKGKLDVNKMLVDNFQGSRTPVTKPTSNPYPVPTRILKKTVPCMRGNDVKWLQWELIQAGFLSATNSKGQSNIDGIFGNDTKIALIAYQKAHGLLDDGKAGSATRYAMLND